MGISRFRVDGHIQSISVSKVAARIPGKDELKPVFKIFWLKVAITPFVPERHSFL